MDNPAPDPLAPTGPYAPPGDAGADAPGEVVGSRYEVLGEIARGGMGVVYRALDRHLQREVAVKVLQSRLAGPGAAARFFAEARTTGQLQHPNIPPVHDVGTLPDGRPYLAMKLIRGRTLEEVLAARTSYAADLDDYVRVFEQVCLAVAFAHARGVIHRDLKPANVMVGGFGEVQVMDWGLAKSLAPAAAPEAERDADAVGDSPNFAHAETAAAADDGTASGTRAGAVIGTLAFMPPEQARGQVGALDERADVFALGGILCVMLTGKPPYVGRTAAEVHDKACAAVLDETYRRLQRSPASAKVAQLAVRCLARHPGQRPRHAGEVAAAVAAIRSGADELRRLDERNQAAVDAARVIDELRAASRLDRARARGLALFGVVGVSLAALSVAAVGLPRMGTAPADPNGWTAPAGGFAGEYLPLARESMRRDVAAGRFRRGFDGSGRETSVRRVERLLPYLPKETQALALAAVAAALDAVPDPEAGDSKWRDAVARLPADDSPELRLGLAVVREHAVPAPDALDRNALARAMAVLKRPAPGDRTDADRLAVAAALADAQKSLGQSN